MTDPNPEHYGHDIPFMYDGIDPRRALWHPVTNSQPEQARNAVEDALGRLAAGRLDEDDLLFVRELARCLLAASDGDDRKTRADHVLRASGLSGRRIEVDARDFIDAVLKLEGLDGWGLAGAIREHMHLLPDGGPDNPITERAARGIIDRERARRRS
ncbi:hypothetical protein [Variovorax sp. LG9.2]|uniref:hypothetical protein n=1 Tax=Variovorax sp. LG9.2 TaxID=3048626 RepID=UPI002B222EEC|nr:hypothetical protein [Variovorax sp. LG9.2]MEB0060045.1 hypothetical protein [Variovorax sp. LG9.2]